MRSREGDDGGKTVQPESKATTRSTEKAHAKPKNKEHWEETENKSVVTERGEGREAGTSQEYGINRYKLLYIK